MVVDDSLTVRKITGRLLAREGYEVVTAKDGVDAMEQLQEIVPDVMLVDIEMPRMDGFDLTRNVRADARLKHDPDHHDHLAHRGQAPNYAREIGVNEYLGKPYQEDELLAQIAGFVKSRARQGPRRASTLAAAANRATRRSRRNHASPRSRTGAADVRARRETLARAPHYNGVQVTGQSHRSLPDRHAQHGRSVFLPHADLHLRAQRSGRARAWWSTGPST